MRISKVISKMRYKAELDTPEWKVKSNEIKCRDYYTCQCCGVNYNLQVHHLAYMDRFKIYEYPGSYYITLCNRCHEIEHVALAAIENNFNNIEKMLTSGMLAIDIYRKLRDNEPLIDQKG